LKWVGREKFSQRERASDPDIGLWDDCALACAAADVLEFRMIAVISSSAAAAAPTSMTLANRFRARRNSGDSKGCEINLIRDGFDALVELSRQVEGLFLQVVSLPFPDAG
jgi:hypothetical protein